MDGIICVGVVEVGGGVAVPLRGSVDPVRKRDRGWPGSTTGHTRSTAEGGGDGPEKASASTRKAEWW